jgi:tetratricopeptide (TPR) repeat protein
MRSVPGHNKYDLNYSIKTLQPTYVQDFKWGAQNLNEWAKAGYVEVEYNGVRLYLLRDSLKDPIYIDPNDAEIHDKLGYVLVKLGQFNEAIVHFREAGSLDGQTWVWATHPDVKMRDANEAIVLAERAAELTAYRKITVLNTLAAAYAAAGQYQRAVTTAQSALDLASVAGDYGWADYLRKRLELYKKKGS